jgi:thiol-disulfide isomerase/thioredoxin
MKAGKRRVLFPLATIILLACTALSGFAQEADTPKPRPKLPGISLAAIDGGAWKLSDNLGKTVILNFWATWCEPCRTEIPYLLKAAKEFKEKDLVVFGVNLDQEGEEKVRRFIDEFKIDYPILIPPKGSPFWALEELPTTLLIDAEGRLVKRYTGAFPEAELRKDILAILESEKVEPPK